MWICLNRAFLSIVEPEAGALGSSPTLLVRARRPGDIESVFPGVKVEKRHERDYLFRALVPREAVAEAIAAEVHGIDYNNFKGSVRNNKLHDAYSAFWNIHSRLQPTAPYSGISYGRQRSML
jgi:hypothetical protein